uniref:Uncharacterized protein n=1 Tax=Skeletonema marinoi TaxID=267567 RepID=A0A7S2KNC8_9STRA|mmetsp:Transcript_14509/g.24351  ORF Transcript_14509/g.24351 Transcript_14509/m.24351 type:complete len:625 (+) Transcript_14509:77-1951(+)
MQPSSSPSICCSRWCRSPDDDKEDTWMEPCRSSTKSKRRSTENIDDCNNNDRTDTTRPLLGDDGGSASELVEPNEELCHSGSSFEAAIRAADASSSTAENDRVTSSYSDTTTPMNNCSAATTTQNGGTTKSSKWRYPFGSSGSRPIIDTMDILGKETVKGLKGALPSPPRGVLDGVKNTFTKSQKEEDTPTTSKVSTGLPITSIAILENGLFVTASKSHKNIKLWKVKDDSPPPPQEKEDSEANEVNSNINERNEIEFICEFKGHVSGVTSLVKLDKRGRFLTASLDKTVKLWEIDCSKDDDKGVMDGPNLLATFKNFHKRWIKCIVPLDEGSFVRPTDDINISMVKAMAKKTALEGPTSMQQAAFERAIIQCSGAFATSSKNGKTVKVWEMSVVDGKANDDSTTNDNVSKVCLAQELQHDAVIEAVEASEDGCRIIVGDVMGVVFLWNKSKSYLSALGVTKSKPWTLIHKFTWRGDIRVHTGEIFQHSITSLCFIGESKFVSGTKEGMVQIWDGSNTKDKPQTIRVAEQPVSRIQKLAMNEANVEGFSVCCDGGRVVALTVKFEGGDVIELDAFPVNCTNEDGESRVITTMKAIVSPCNDPRLASLIVGDDNGAVHLSHTKLV